MDDLDDFVGRMARLDHRPNDAPRSPLQPHSPLQQRYNSRTHTPPSSYPSSPPTPSRSPSQLSSRSSNRSIHSQLSAKASSAKSSPVRKASSRSHSYSNEYEGEEEEDEEATPNPNTGLGVFASPSAFEGMATSPRFSSAASESGSSVAGGSLHHSNSTGSRRGPRLQPRSAVKGRTPMDDLEFFKETMGATSSEDQWSEHGSDVASITSREPKKQPSARSLRLRADIERTANQLRLKASQEALERAQKEETEPAEAKAVVPPHTPEPRSPSTSSKTSKRLSMVRVPVSPAVQLEAEALERSTGKSSTTSATGDRYWPASPKGSIASSITGSISASIASVPGSLSAPREERSSQRTRQRETREWSQVCWVWQREKASHGLMSKAPLIREVPNVMKRKMGKRDSSQLLAIDSLSTPDDKRSAQFREKGLPIGPSSSGREGSFKKVTAVLRDDGYLRLYSEEKLILHAVHLPSVLRTDIHIVNQSLFSRKNCIVIHRRPNSAATQGLGLGSSTPSDSNGDNADESIYLCMPSTTALQTWIVMAHCFAQPEFYVAGGIHLSPPLRYKGGSDGEDTDSLDEAEDANLDSCRINRTVMVTINEGKALGELGTARIGTPGSRTRPTYERELSSFSSSTTTSSFDSSMTHDSSPSKRLHRGADLLREEGAQPLDSYCEIVVDGDVAARSAVRRATASPFWSETFVFTELPPLVNPVLVRVLALHKNSRPTLIGTATLRPGDLPRGVPSNEWYPIRPPNHERGRQTDTMGELSLTVRVDEQVVLPSREYAEMLAMLNDDKDAILAKEIAHEFASDLEEITKVLLRIYQAESQLVPRILRLVEEEVDGDLKSAAILFRGNSILTKSVELYLRLVGNEFLETAIGEPVRRLCAEKVDAEIDPSRMKQGVKEKEMTNNVTTLTDWTLEIWNSIYDAREKCPNELRQIFAHIQQVVTKKYGEEQKKMRSTSVSAFVFLRFFVPAVLNPKLFGIVSSSPDPKAQRTLTLIAKTLQGLANFSTFGQKEPWMLAMDPFVQKNTAGFVDFIEHISTPSIASRYEWTSPHSPLYLASYRLRNSLPASTREGIPLLPHLIDLPRELGVLASFVARGQLEKGVMPFFESSRDTNAANRSPVQSERFNKLSDICVEAHVEAQRRGGGLVGTVQNAPSKRDEKEKFRSRSATVKTSDAWSTTSSLRHSQVSALASPRTPPRRSKDDSTFSSVGHSPTLADLGRGSNSPRQKHRSFTVGGIPPRLGSLPPPGFAEAGSSSEGGHSDATPAADTGRALRRAGLTPDEPSDNVGHYSFPSRPRVADIRMVQEVTTTVETLPISSSEDDEEQHFEEASPYSPSDSPPFTSLPLRAETSNSSHSSIAEVAVGGGAPTPEMERGSSTSGVLVGDLSSGKLALMSKMMRRVGSVKKEEH